MTDQAIAPTPDEQPDVPEPAFPDNIRVLPTGMAGRLSYEGCVVRVMQLMGAIDEQPITPELALERIQAGLVNFDTQTKVLHETLENQNNVLVALAKLTRLEPGSLFSAMVPIVESWKPPDTNATA